MSITHISDREQALERENARLLDTVRFQSEALALINETIAGLNADAERYRALKRRHGYLMVARLIGESGYSSQKSDGIIDAFADNAIIEIAAWDSKTQEEKNEYFLTESAAVIKSHAD